MMANFQVFLHENDHLFLLNIRCVEIGIDVSDHLYLILLTHNDFIKRSNTSCSVDLIESTLQKNTETDTYMAMPFAGSCKLHLSKGICGRLWRVLRTIPVADDGCAKVIVQRDRCMAVPRTPALAQPPVAAGGHTSRQCLSSHITSNIIITPSGHQHATCNVPNSISIVFYSVPSISTVLQKPVS